MGSAEPFRIVADSNSYPGAVPNRLAACRKFIAARDCWLIQSSTDKCLDGNVTWGSGASRCFIFRRLRTGGGSRADRAPPRRKAAWGTSRPIAQASTRCPLAIADPPTRLRYSKGLSVQVEYETLVHLLAVDPREGASIDTVEAVANRLGIEAQHVMIPADHLLDIDDDSEWDLRTVRATFGASTSLSGTRCRGYAGKTETPGRLSSGKLVASAGGNGQRSNAFGSKDRQMR